MKSKKQIRAKAKAIHDEISWFEVEMKKREAYSDGQIFGMLRERDKLYEKWRILNWVLSA